MAYRTTGDQLSAFIDRHGLANKRLAEQLGGTPSDIHYIRHDEVIPRLETLVGIMCATGHDVTDIIMLRNREAFEEQGLDGEIASLLFYLGQLDDGEREKLMGAVTQIMADRDKEGPWPEQL